jgi:predicted murein hydrolase (TIGR00659 family)
MNAVRLVDVWVYLSASPLLHLTMTVGAYALSDWVYRKSGNRSLLHPVLIAVIVLVAVLAATNTDYASYFDGAQFVHFFLGPATVALAVPLYLNFARLREMWLPLSAGLLVGALTAALSAVFLAWLFDAAPQTLLALAPKSVTAPVAMGITEKLGGPASLTAILVVSTGILGAVIGPTILDWCRVNDPAVRGFAMGTTSHGIGTARAFQESGIAGAFSGLAMGLNTLVSSLLIPPLLGVLGLVP